MAPSAATFSPCSTGGWDIRKEACMLKSIPILAALAMPALFAAQTSTSVLLHQVHSDARQIHAQAMQIEKLAAQPASAWNQFDTQWNEIKPVEEALMLNLRSLEAR